MGLFSNLFTTKPAAGEAKAAGITSIFITGATDGMGKLLATDLARQFPEAAILLHGRNPDKLQAVAKEIKQLSGNQQIETFLADFSSLSEVRRMADELLQKHNRISLLINNAGTGINAPRYTREGMETRLTVNYLAPFLLTHLLLPAIKNAAPSRVVNVSSGGQSPIQFDDIMMEKNFDAFTAYNQSKLALILFTFDLATALKSDAITVNCLHPGTFLDTNMVREAGIEPRGTAQSGADAIMNLATSARLQKVTGKYFNVQKEAAAHQQAYEADARKKLRTLSLQLTGMGGI